MDFSRDFICNTFYHDTTTGKIYRKKNNKEVTNKDKDGYILVDATYEKGKQGRMRGARLVWVLYNGNIPDGHVVDHVNRVRDDNRLENLRLASHKQNSVNSLRSNRETLTSSYKGVQQDTHGRWRATIQENGITSLIGVYSDEKAAAHAYDKEATLRFGSYALINNVPEVDLSMFDAQNKRKEIQELKRGLPQYLIVVGDLYVYRKSGKHIASFDIVHKDAAVEFAEHFNNTGCALIQKENLQMFNRNGLPKNITSCSTGFRASFLHNYKRFHVGTFASVEEAVIALNKKRLEVIDDD